jgi:RNA polymerase sigma factor (sigma-70 family)
MLKPWRVTYSHEEVFLQRYDRLLGWTLSLTGHNQERAEDLVQDAFIQFTLSRPDLDSIHNLEGYLFAIVRNLHLSQIRREARNPIKPLDLIEYDSAEMGLRYLDPRAQAQVRDQLRSICQYACIRKETSKAGSVLILRFFHGYYPGEIAQVMNGPRRAVDDWLRIARREAKLFAENPRRLGLSKEPLAVALSNLTFDDTPFTFLSEFRRAIFASRQGQCLSIERLKGLYSNQTEPIDSTILGHIVSCPRCLDEVNRLLGLPPLSDRYPTDMLGPDGRSKNGNGNAPFTGPKRDADWSCHQRSREVFEHSPKELFISVNGFILGSQKVGSEINEQTLTVNVAEKIGFVEVFSEQGVRLLFSTIEPPPEGTADQPASVELSEGRSLDVQVSFRDTWPALRTLYCDPTLIEAPTQELELESPARPDEIKTQSVKTKSDKDRTDSWLRKTLAGFSFLFRPGTVTVMVAIALVTTIVFLRTRPTQVSAAELLKKADASAAAIFAKPDIVVHRMVNIEEIRPGDEDHPISRRRVEIWINGSKGVKARRVYDERGMLVAGQWTASDGSQTVYRRGAGTQVIPADANKSANENKNVLLEELWQIEPSAKDFAEIASQIDTAQVEEKADFYVVNYQPAAAESEALQGRLVKAALKLRKSDLHPVEQILQLRRNGEIREYRMVESQFERHATTMVSPGIFRPDPEIAKLITSRGASALRREDSTGLTPPATSSGGVSAAALAGFEVDALYHLHRLGACLRDHTNVSKTSDGGLRVQAIVETEGRKGDLLAALNTLSVTPGVMVDVMTVSEALEKQASLPTKPSVMRRIEIRGDRIPAHTELRDYFSERLEHRSSQGGQVSEKEVEEEIRRFANRMLSSSRRALLQAWALRQLTAGFSSAEMQMLDGESRNKLQAIVRDHARLFEQETRIIIEGMGQVFFAGAGSGDSDSSADSNLWQAAEQIFQMASFHEKTIREAFALSTQGGAATGVKSEQFWKSLRTARRLASQLQQ